MTHQAHAEDRLEKETQRGSDDGRPPETRTVEGHGPRGSSDALLHYSRVSYSIVRYRSVHESTTRKQANLGEAKLFPEGYGYTLQTEGDSASVLFLRWPAGVITCHRGGRITHRQRVQAQFEGHMAIAPEIAASPSRSLQHLSETSPHSMPRRARPVLLTSGGEGVIEGNTVVFYSSCCARQLIRIDELRKEQAGRQQSSHLNSQRYNNKIAPLPQS